MTGFGSKRAAAADKTQEPVLDLDGHVVGKARKPAQEQNTITFKTSSDWVMRITADRRIEVNEGVEVTEAAKKVLEALQSMLKPAQEPIAYVTGTYNGRFVVAPLNPAMVLPVGMAFYTAPPKRTEQEQLLPPVEIGVDVTADGASVVAFYRRPNAVMEMFYSQFHPAPKREWVGLTPEETSGFTQHEMTVVKYVSKVLQEKNT